MTTQTRIFLAKRYIEDLLLEIPDKINAYEWQDLRLVVYSGRERREIARLKSWPIIARKVGRGLR